MQRDALYRIGESEKYRTELETAVLSAGPKGSFPEGLHKFFNSIFINTDRDVFEKMISSPQAQAAVLTDEGLAQVEETKEAFSKSLADILVVDGRCHTACGEPVYLYQRGTYRDHPTVRVADSAYWPGPNRRPMYHDAECRFLTADMFEELGTMVAEDNARQNGFIEIHDGFSPSLRLGELEYDRIARQLMEDTGRWLSRNDALFQRSRDIIDRWIDLRDFLSSYDPLEGVPDEIEDRFEPVAAIYQEAGYPGAVKPADIDYARRNWSERVIDAPILSASFSRG